MTATEVSHGDPRVLESLIWGLISALSLNIGSAIGITCLPRARVRAALMSFGGGSLIFALTIELFGHALHLNETGECENCIYVMEVFAVLGGSLFMGINWILARGLCSKVSCGSLLPCCRRKLISADDSSVTCVVPFSPSQSSIPAIAVIKASSPITESTATNSAEDILSNDSADDVSDIGIIEEGRAPGMRRDIAVIAINVDDEPHEAKVTSHYGPNLVSPKSLQPVTSHESRGGSKFGLFSPSAAAAWSRAISGSSVHSGPDGRAPSKMSSPGRLSQMHTISMHDACDHDHLHQATMVWLGILLDAIPESVVIGILVNASDGDVGKVLPLVIGVFLSNLPESMSASGTMDLCGMPRWKITSLWASVTVVTCIGAVVGALLFPPGTSSEPGSAIAISSIEGLAAGAMLTMIAQTMMPEAHEQGGNVVGLSCLAGFLCAQTVKVLPIYG